MRLSLFAALAVLGLQASAQPIEGTIVEDKLVDIPSAANFLGERAMNIELKPRDSAINEFCSAGSDSVAMVLSSRITDDEATQCVWGGDKRITEVFDRYHGYVYFNVETDDKSLFDQYRIWTDPNIPIEPSELQQYLNRDEKILPNILQTSAPDTCLIVNVLACSDGSYCCNGSCVPNNDSCN